jgi:hypothetical protein
MYFDHESEHCPGCGYFTYETTQCVPKVLCEICEREVLDITSSLERLSERLVVCSRKNAAIAAATVIRIWLRPLNLTGASTYSGFPPSAIVDASKLIGQL